MRILLDGRLTTDKGSQSIVVIIENYDGKLTIDENNQESNFRLEIDWKDALQAIKAIEQSTLNNDVTM